MERVRAPTYAEHSSCSHDAVIRVYDNAGNVIETHEHAATPGMVSHLFAIIGSAGHPKANVATK
jgi:hypothetical protein